MEKLRYMNRNLEFVNEAQSEEASEIKTAIANVKAVVRKYAKSDKAMMKEMIKSLSDMEKDLKTLAKPAKAKKINEAASTSGKTNVSGDYVYAVWFAYDGGELFHVRAITDNLDEAIDAFNEQVQDLDDYGADDRSDISLVKLPNTKHVLDLLEKCTDEDNYEHFQDEAEELDRYVIEYIDSRL